MKSPDHPELTFVQAAGYTKGRPDGPPLWIVVHDMEASETRLRAENTAAYFADPPDDRRVSSHYCVDDTSVVQCVRLGDVAWTVGNRPGNYRGINWELSGFASQTREQWLDEFGLAMFAQMRPYVRADAAKFGIPLVRRSVSELKVFKAGITSHNDLREAFGKTSHTDPGPNFPWDVFLQIMNKGDDMALRDDLDFWYLMHRVRGLENMDDPIVIPAHAPTGTAARSEPNLLAQALKAAAAPVLTSSMKFSGIATTNPE